MKNIKEQQQQLEEIFNKIITQQQEKIESHNEESSNDEHEDHSNSDPENSSNDEHEDRSNSDPENSSSSEHEDRSNSDPDVKINLFDLEDEDEDNRPDEIKKLPHDLSYMYDLFEERLANSEKFRYFCSQLSSKHNQSIVKTYQDAFLTLIHDCDYDKRQFEKTEGQFLSYIREYEKQPKQMKQHLETLRQGLFMLRDQHSTDQK